MSRGGNQAPRLPHLDEISLLFCRASNVRGVLYEFHRRRCQIKPAGFRLKSRSSLTQNFWFELTERWRVDELFFLSVIIEAVKTNTQTFLNTMSSLPFLLDASRTPRHVFPICFFFLRFWKQAELKINTSRVHYTLENRFHQSGSSFVLRLPILWVKERKTRGGGGRSITRDGSVTDLNMKAAFHSADKLPDPRVGMISGLT